MSRPRPTVAEVIRSCIDEFMDKYGGKLSCEQRRALDDLTACRTAALGGHVLECSECGHQQIAYNSCGNRHCPTCQATAAARWLEAHAADLLPVPHFHLVFTLGFPEPRNPPLVALWVFLGQVLSADHSCRAAVARLIAHRLSRGTATVLCRDRRLLPGQEASA